MGAIPKIFQTSTMTILLILGSFAAGLFFRGTDNIMVLPHLGALLFFSALTLQPCFSKGLSIPRSPVIILFLSYWLYIWISTLWSTVPYNSTLFAFIFSVLPFMFFTLILAPNPLPWLRTHMTALGVGLAVLCIWAMIQYFFLDFGARVHHPMLNPNNLAVIFNMGLFPALMLYFYSKTKLHTLLGFILAVLCVFAMFSTQSRGGLLSFIIAALPFFIFVRKQVGFTPFKLLAFLFALIISFVTVHYISAGTLGDGLIDVMMPGTEADARTVFERKLIWTGTLHLIHDHFWLGTGLGSFTYFYPRYRSPQDFSDGYFAHMDPLQFWAEMGVLAPLLFYSLLIAILARTLHAAKKADQTSPEHGWMWAFFCGLLALAGHAHISFHLYMPVNLFIAAFLLAGWYLSSEKILGNTRTTFKFKAAPAAIASYILFSAILLLSASWMARAAAGVHFINETSRFMVTKNDNEERRALDQARFFAPASYSPLYDYEAKYRMNMLSDRSEPKTQEEQQKLYQEALTYIDRAISLNSGFSGLWNRKAMLYFIAFPNLDAQGRDKAEELLKKSLEANPLLLDSRLGLSYLYRSKGNLSAARAILEGAIKYPMPKTSTTLALYNELARVTLETGNLAGYNALIAQRNNFAQRYDLKITQPFPLSQKEVERLLKNRNIAPKQTP